LLAPALVCGRCKQKTIQNALRAKELAPKRISGFRNFAFDRKNAEGISDLSQRRQHQPAWDLNRYLSMPKRLIFASSVEPGMPSLAAAPVAPDIRP
jgi:hypothetical protein